MSHWGCALLGFVLLISPLPAASTDWTIVKHEGRDYLPLGNVAAFYRFPTNFVPVNKRVDLDNGRASLEVHLNSREILINGVRHWLAFPVVQLDDKVLVSRIDLVKTLEPQLRPHMVTGLTPFKTVVLDAGHGGHDKGAFSPFGYEKDFALDIARRIKPLLEQKGFKVVMTRTTDAFVPLETRAAMANKQRDAIFVSIHFNATDSNLAANGFEVFSMTPRGMPSTGDEALQAYHLTDQPGNGTDTASYTLATCVHTSLLGNVAEADRGVKRARFAVLRLTKAPAILVEGGFLSNSSDSRMVASSAWRQKLADAVVKGLDGYKVLAEQKIPPKMLADYRRQTPTSVTLRDATTPAGGSFTPAVIIPTTGGVQQKK